MILKIDDKIFNCENVHSQLTIEGGMDIIATISKSDYPQQAEDIIKYFERKMPFSLMSNKFISKKSLIKMLFIKDNNVEIHISSDKVDIGTYKEYRDKRIEELLN